MEKKILMFVCILLLTTPICHALTFGEFLAGAVGVAAAPFVIPAALGVAGFTAGGIAAGSLGAAAMSASAPVAAGSFVAIAQSIGATGAIGMAGKAIGGGVGYAAYRATKDDD
ncbi:interferon alpha-inducible protein 27-like protein 2 isoform X2 [Mytilus trossulus]|uniref:interferon alpha-inducible protein 27-like protein 2 isoform X2 n=2 Tax=Mytilus trossulus TaxID=6551 RepID=UPI0030064DFA